MQKERKIGVLTIGQSPRIDVTPSFQSILGNEVLIKEAGALDQLTEEELVDMLPDQGDIVYVSRLRNGKSAKMGKSKVMPLLQTALHHLETDVSLVIVLCTGELQGLSSSKPILYPDTILKNVIGATLGMRKMGIIIPLAEQAEKMFERWSQFDVEIEAASPYAASDIEMAAEKLKAKGAAIILLSCMGYSEAHKAAAIKGSNLPVILPRTLIAKIASEYL